MRRPLFTTGIPQLAPGVADPVANPGNALTVLDLRNASVDTYSRAHVLTLYAVHTRSANTSLLGLVTQVGSDTPVLQLGLSMASGDGVVKLVDRMPIRGPVRVLVADLAERDNTYIYGYLELENEAPRMPEIRPLQPSDPVSPFTAVPQKIIADAAAADVHTLSGDYIDVLTLDYQSAAGGEFDGDFTITFPDGTALSLETSDAPTTRLFDGIPMTYDGTIQAEHTLTNAIIVGSFYRY